MTVDLQTCGHPVACIEGRTTMYCSMCALIAERDAALDRVRELTNLKEVSDTVKDLKRAEETSKSVRPATGRRKGDLARRTAMGDWVALELVEARKRIQDLEAKVRGKSREEGRH